MYSAMRLGSPRMYQTLPGACCARLRTCCASVGTLPMYRSFLCPAGTRLLLKGFPRNHLVPRLSRNHCCFVGSCV